ncbi:4-hydroxy-tetrahydrodipicolinate reductase [Tuanshanicoccus lijuaniae]|uniref:4-hydroxy-tetrahydrodipicolinate reductase n=1 Tax=Aerococcaceae bacterium zg-1292 TaxID=2774330 RepID=UPI0019358A3B|nr:4-hydroxy-tetrahydrodipicolinate reductase [Aerococcaceae bacterium zg-1292]MBS4455824.1 4-hydroxy-tetrahydrodipicolinate reductase [Aerococcaceae bacterium zg-A91]MBS4457638.1 4-hydroxy-tetrahydrodipicolinate reductase [Aerococcaceae bacterium zg-BR33]QQA37951.1 4-hydroxy-tetrahydrodipicolinate reductase [Aerococcaceae bacterium zg-1292]
MQIILVGSSGAMGQSIVRFCEQDNPYEIYAGVQSEQETDELYPVFHQFEHLAEYVINQHAKPDVIIDFSSPYLTQDLLAFATTYQVPVVLATTGQDESQVEQIRQASHHVAMLDTHNTSIGVAVMQQTLATLTRTLYPLGYDIEIIEKHHRYKKDSPSGTAIMLKQTIESMIDETMTPIYGREGLSPGRKREEIGIHAIRGGDIVGEHTVIFANNQETIEITHRAGSKELFVRGALQCAEFIVQQSAGLYNMADLMKGK